MELSAVRDIKLKATSQENNMPEYRHLDISPTEQVKRYKRFYGGLVFDKLFSLGIRENTFSPRFRPLRQDMILTGHVLTVKMHSHADSEEVIRERGDLP